MARKIVTLDAWRNRGIEDFELPSGAGTIKLRRSPVSSLVATGKIPNQLALAAFRLNMQAMAAEEGEAEELSAEDIEEGRRYAAARVCAQVLEPKLTVEDFFTLPDVDQDALLDWVVAPEMGAMLDLLPFREGRGGDAAGEHGPDVGEVAG